MFGMIQVGGRLGLGAEALHVALAWPAAPARIIFRATRRFRLPAAPCRRRPCRRGRSPRAIRNRRNNALSPAPHPRPPPPLEPGSAPGASAGQMRWRAGRSDPGRRRTSQPLVSSGWRRGGSARSAPGHDAGLPGSRPGPVALRFVLGGVRVTGHSPFRVCSQRAGVAVLLPSPGTPGEGSGVRTSCSPLPVLRERGPG